MRFDCGEVAAGKEMLQCLSAGVAQLAAIAKVTAVTPTDQRYLLHRVQSFVERATRLSSGG